MRSCEIHATCFYWSPSLLLFLLVGAFLGLGNGLISRRQPTPNSSACLCSDQPLTLSWEAGSTFIYSTYICFVCFACRMHLYGRPFLAQGHCLRSGSTLLAAVSPREAVALDRVGSGLVSTRCSRHPPWDQGAGDKHETQVTSAHSCHNSQSFPIFAKLLEICLHVSPDVQHSLVLRYVLLSVTAHSAAQWKGRCAHVSASVKGTWGGEDSHSVSCPLAKE